MTIAIALLMVAAQFAPSQPGPPSAAPSPATNGSNGTSPPSTFQGAPPAPTPQVGPPQAAAPQAQTPSMAAPSLPCQSCPTASCLPNACQTCPTQSCPTTSCQTQLIERTVMTPTTVFEKRIVPVTKYRPEIREQVSTIYEQVPQTREIQEEYTVLVPEQRTRTVTDIVQRQVRRNIEQPYTVMVPQQEMREASRTVCRMVAVPETQMVTELSGHWETRALGQPYMSAYGSPESFGSSCNGGGCAPSCSPCPQQCTTRVWVPEQIERPVTVTTMKPVQEEQTYQYPVTVFKPETRTRTVEICEWQPQQVTREENFTVEVPQKRVQTRQITEYRSVPRQQRSQCTVMVAYQENVEVQVPVCHWIPQKITSPIQVCSTFSACPTDCAPQILSGNGNLPPVSPALQQGNGDMFQPAPEIGPQAHFSARPITGLMAARFAQPMASPPQTRAPANFYARFRLVGIGSSNDARTWRSNASKVPDLLGTR